MKSARTVSHYVAEPPPPDWREWLAARLGQRPRRIGLWAELALYGARRCLDDAGHAALPADALLRVASVRGPMSAAQSAVEQSRSGLPMPFTFLQSQPCQLLASLGQHLGWQGDARFVVCRDRAALLRLAERESGARGLLFGWVEEGETQSTEWWWLHAGAQAHPWAATGR